MERSSTSLFVNAEVFNDQHLLNVVHGRDEQMRQLRSSLAPVFRGAKPLHVLLIGQPGTGKTLVARYILTEVTAKGVPASYINCMEHPTLFAVLDRITWEHHVLRSERISTAYKLEQVEHFLKNRPFLLILDEIDRVPPKDRTQLLYTLANLGKLGLVCIASNPGFLHVLDENVRSRLSPTVIEFTPYDVEQLAAIILQRADVGLIRDACHEETARELATLAAGDARTAVQTLRRAAVSAGQRAAGSVTVRDARNGWQDGAQLKRAYTLSLLNDHQRAVFRLLQAFGEMTSVRLWQEFVIECERLGLRVIAPRTFSHYMNKLEMLGLVEVRRAQAKGNTRAFRIVSLANGRGVDDAGVDP